MSDVRAVRERLLDFLTSDLIGPANGPDEIIEVLPRLAYVAGVLFPRTSQRNESSAVGGAESEEPREVGSTGSEFDLEETDPDSLAAQEVHDVAPDEPRISRSEHLETTFDDIVTLANTYRPSAIGMSFLVDEGISTLQIQVRAAEYVETTEAPPASSGPVQVPADSKTAESPPSESEASSSNDSKPDQSSFVPKRWRRHPIKIGALTASLQGDAPSDLEVVPGLSLRVVRRPRAGGRTLVTLSLYNTTMAYTKEAKTFFQCGFEVRSTSETEPFLEYRSVEGLSLGEEELSLEMLYRRRRVFGVGHGCSPDWDHGSDDRARILRTKTLPAVRVPPINPLQENRPEASMDFLAGLSGANKEDIIAALEAFCARYGSWIDDRKAEANDLEERFHSVASSHLEKCRRAHSRMCAGVALLGHDDLAFEAFQLTNRVMLMQQHHSRLRRALSSDWKPLPRSDEYRTDQPKGRGRWRAFQLAFLLMSLPGLYAQSGSDDPSDSEDRDIVDLIWFPTGGGKTEAYLATTAFLIFASRLRGTDRPGCQILMRYTLRLLTSQQFQRAASLICACELLRRENPERFGQTPITIGLWVGMSSTPNKEKEALRALGRLEKGRLDAKNPFQLLSCPWCGTELDNRKRLGYREEANQLRFLCPGNPRKNGETCPFSTYPNFLPVFVVDDAIYRAPPTLLIGTVDKFAMLAWRKEAGSIFETGGGPDLIIQDELHLISGPLGSMVGLYEGAIEYLCSQDGRSPKIIASTATIRRAEDQCRNLYDRSMFQFPPPGLDASDSYFAKEDPSAPGRVYVGLLPTAASSPLTAQVRSVAALQQGIMIAAGPGAAKSVIDPYWTLVQYFGSLKELGRAATFVTSDIPEYLPVLHKRYGLSGDDRRWMNTSEELTSRKNEDEIPKILKRLEQPYERGARIWEQALDTVLATNMISVGMDVDRLGLMMIVTQPKGTSEYIQASSRVGRSREGPGLIVTLYNAGRPRDRSHFEGFRGYHDGFYRYVEPTSVTPFSPPALRRALHAILVIGARHVSGSSKPADFDPSDQRFADYIQFIRERVEKVDPIHLQDFEAFLADRLDEWSDRRPGSFGSFSPEQETTYLMRPAGRPAEEADPDSWETPTSMRNVDVECDGRVVGRYFTSPKGQP